jgi:competence protein ComEC
VTVLVGLVSLPLASLFAWPVRLGLWLLVFTVKATAAVPFAAVTIPSISVWWLVLWYGIILVVVYPSVGTYLIYPVAWWRTAAQPARLSLAAAMVLLVATSSVWRLALADSPDTLRLTMLDIGQGDALVLQAPGGYTMLIDAGPAAPPEPKRGLAGYDTGASVVVPFLKQQGIRKLDYVELTHPHQDHAGGMAAVMRAFPVSHFLDTQLAYEANGYTNVLQVVQAKQIPVHRPVVGERITLGPAVTLDVLNPPVEQIHGSQSDENNNSIVFLLQYHNIRMLLAGEMEAFVEERLLAEGALLKADLLKVAHHGSATSSIQPFLERVHPRWALIPVGAGNPFGHPNKGTLERLRGQGAAIYRSDQVGAVTVTTNGTTLTIDTAKPIPVPNTVGIFGRRWISAW